MSYLLLNCEGVGILLRDPRVGNNVGGPRGAQIGFDEYFNSLETHA